MAVQTQQPNIIHVLGRLDLTDLSIDNPSVDPGVLTPVFPIDPTWLNPEYLAVYSGPVDISGGAVVWDDNQAGVINFATPPDLTKARVYHNILVILDPGTVGTQLVTVQAFSPGAAANTSYRAVLDNPGNHNCGPVYIPAGWTLHITCATGGAGDFIYIHCSGFQAPAGVPLPLFGGPSLNET